MVLLRNRGLASQKVTKPLPGRALACLGNWTKHIGKSSDIYEDCFEAGSIYQRSGDEAIAGKDTRVSG